MVIDSPIQIATNQQQHQADRHQSERLQSELLLVKAVMEQMPDFLFAKDVNSRFLYCNQALVGIHGGFDADGFIGKTDFDIHSQAQAEEFYRIEQEIIATGVAISDMEEWFADCSGAFRCHATTKIPLRDRNNNVIGLIGIGRDVTERKRMEAYRDEEGALLEMIAKNAPLPSILGRLVALIESQMEGIFASVLVLDANDRLRTGAAPSLPEAYCRAIDGASIGPSQGSCGTAAFLKQSIVVADIQSDPLWLDYRDLAARFDLRSCWSTPIISHEGTVLGTFAMYSSDVRLPTVDEIRLTDVAIRIAGIAMERQQSEDRIKFMAHHDALTGLPNRTLLTEHLSRCVKHADVTGGRVYVIFVDLDNFKIVNDGLGHDAGDYLLKTLAARMSSSVSPADSVIRLSGDEFVMLTADQPGSEEAGVRLSALQRLISEPVDIGGRLVETTCSIGVAIYPCDGRDIDTLLKNADAAMYGAKEAGRNNVQFYTSKMNARADERRALQEQMRHAVERAELSLVYQPQIDLKSGLIFAVEALLRWRHPIFGLISPATMIPIAEDSGLIVSIGAWVLQTACVQNKAWQDAGADPVSIAVNVSARQFKERDWIDQVDHALRASRMDVRHLELEVTESMLMDDVDHAIATMRRLKDAGVRFAIDDFGTGYSSLSALKSFSVGRLKIDRSFVRDISFDENDKAIVSAIVSMGHKLGLRVIAEGVETAQQLAFLRANDCDEAQGYLFGRPVPAPEMEALLLAQSALRGPAGRRTARSSSADRKTGKRVLAQERSADRSLVRDRSAG